MSTASIPVVWWDGRKGFWDHGQILSFFDGDLYGVPVQYTFDHVTEKFTTYHWNQGGVLIVPGPEMAYKDLPEVRALVEALVERMPWAVIHFLSDEEIRFPYDTIPSSSRKIHWLQNPWPGRYGRIPLNRRWCTGVRPDTRAILGHLRHQGVARDLLWSFSGQGTHAHRMQCIEALRASTDMPHELAVSDGFGKGLEYSDYLRSLLRSKVVPCPSGVFLADSFRMAEALEAGALPIVQHRGPSGSPENYWSALWPHMDVPIVPDWTSLPSILRDYRDHPVALQVITNRATSWWIKAKRTTALSLTDDIQAASGQAPTPLSSLANTVTVLMPTSPIPTHPSTELIESSIARIRAYPELAHAEIILMIDGVRAEQESRLADYEEYKRRLIELCNHDPRFRGCLPLVFDRHKHQAGMTIEALNYVRTPLVFFVEHDTFPMGDIPFDEIAGAMVKHGVPVVRFHIFEQVLSEHQPLYDAERHEIDGVPFLRTRQWSQRPHLAQAWWYRRLLGEHFSANDCTMIEDCVHGPIQESPWDKYQVRIYAPVGSLLRSGTVDGRQGDPKFPMYYRSAWR